MSERDSTSENSGSHPLVSLLFWLSGNKLQENEAPNREKEKKQQVEEDSVANERAPRRSLSWLVLHLNMWELEIEWEFLELVEHCLTRQLAALTTGANFGMHPHGCMTVEEFDAYIRKWTGISCLKIPKGAPRFVFTLRECRLPR